MNVYVPTSVRPTAGPHRISARQAPSKRALLWLGGVVISATLLSGVLLLAASFVSSPTGAQEIRTTEPDPLYQQKHDAVEQELPAQF